MFSFGQSQDSRNAAALAVIARHQNHVSPQDAMQTPSQRDASFRNIPVKATEKYPILNSIKNDQRVRDAYVGCNFYYSNAVKHHGNKDRDDFIACSDCSKSSNVRNNGFEGLSALIQFHNQKLSPQCTPKQMPVTAHSPSGLYMQNPHPPQGVPSYYQNSSAVPMQGTPYPQPGYPSQHGYRP